MKKLLAGLLLLTLSFISAKVDAISFEEVLSQSKPCAILVYADWADQLQPVLATYGGVEQSYAKKYNFAKVNICKEEARNFNKTFYIYQNVPYILLFKERGRMSRVITRDCILDNSCIKDKLDFFAN